jgi:hypothetical protein
MTYENSTQGINLFTSYSSKITRLNRNLTSKWPLWKTWSHFISWSWIPIILLHVCENTQHRANWALILTVVLSCFPWKTVNSYCFCCPVERKTMLLANYPWLVFMDISERSWRKLSGAANQLVFKAEILIDEFVTFFTFMNQEDFHP